MVLQQNGDTYSAGTVGSDEAATAIRMLKRAEDGMAPPVYEDFPDGSTSSRPKTESYKGQLGRVRAANGNFYLTDPYVHAVYKIAR